MSDDDQYSPHRWHWLNGFWAECSCGYRDSSFSETLLRRRMNRHVREATEQDYIASQINANRGGR